MTDNEINAMSNEELLSWMQTKAEVIAEITMGGKNTSTVSKEDRLGTALAEHAKLWHAVLARMRQPK